MNKSNKIPGEIEFAIAKKKMNARLGLETEIRERIFSSIPRDLPCHDIWVWVSDEKAMVSYVYPQDSDLAEHEKTGVKAQIEEAIKKIGCFFKSIAFDTEYHSHEYVLSKFNGNYDKYFR